MINTFIFAPKSDVSNGIWDFKNFMENHESELSKSSLWELEDIYNEIDHEFLDCENELNEKDEIIENDERVEKLKDLIKEALKVMKTEKDIKRVKKILERALI